LVNTEDPSFFRVTKGDGRMAQWRSAMRDRERMDDETRKAANSPTARAKSVASLPPRPAPKTPGETARKQRFDRRSNLWRFGVPVGERAVRQVHSSETQ
jgi:hypothetical protein